MTDSLTLTPAQIDNLRQLKPDRYVREGDTGLITGVLLDAPTFQVLCRQVEQQAAEIAALHRIKTDLLGEVGMVRAEVERLTQRLAMAIEIAKASSEGQA